MPEHQSSFHSDLFSTPADPRVSRLETMVRSHDPLERSITGYAADANHTASAFRQSYGRRDVMLHGVIVQTLPGLDWYSVATTEMGVIACCRLRDSIVPVGGQDVGALAPGNPVLVFYNLAMPHGIILGVIPPPLEDSRLAVADHVSQGGGTGLKREEGFLFPAASFEGEVRDFGVRRPLDETSLDRGVLTETGVGWTVTPFEATFRASELATLSVSLFDNSTRLHGWNMTVFSGAHLFEAGDDEGEPWTYYGESSFGWESRGLYSRGDTFGSRYSDQDVQYDKFVASHDLAEDDQDVEPVHRYVRYGGYLGGGEYRFVAKPAGTSGARKRRDAETHDTGLWMESIGRQGAYMMVSAHSVHIGKRFLIAVPRRSKGPADPQGDDAAAENYLAAGTYGDGEQHVVGELAYTGDDANLVRAATSADFVIYGMNWKTLAPFHYHENDFRLPQERQMQGKARSSIDFSKGAAGGIASPPSARSVAVDSVTGPVDYYETMSGWTLLPDGGVVFTDGYGGRILLTGGKLFLDAPLGIHLRTGGELLCLSEQTIFRAKRSVDISATEHDIRLAGNRNVQIASGLGGQGTMLIEGKGKGRSQFYDKRIGEDVAGGGVVIKAADGVAGIVGADVYIRSTDNDITFDAGAGEGSIYMTGDDVTIFSTQDVNFFLGATPDSPEVTHVYTFGKNQAIMASDVILNGRIYGLGESGLVMRGDVVVTGSVACAGSMADRKGWFLGKVPDGFRRELDSAIDETESNMADYTGFAGDLYTAVLAERYYGESQLGNETTLEAVTFSFRDDSKQAQYGTRSFVMLEPSWSELVRLGAATGMSAKWKEMSVNVQGTETYPYPGKIAWTSGKTMLTVTTPAAYDAKTGVAKDRPMKSSPPTTTKKSPDNTIYTVR